VQTNIVDAYRHHQIDRLFVSGVSVGINTDARTISRITLGSEYEVLHRTFGWGSEHFRQCNLNAVEAAFVPDSLKKKLTSRLLEEYARCS
jgi:adenosine deaminase